MLDIIKRMASHITTFDELKAKLALKRPLRVKYGIDPTNPNIHLGHTVPLRLLREFQREGHKAVIIFGDYTASLGDPSGRDQLRASTTGLAEARKNSVLFRKQLNKLLEPDYEEYLNSGWLQNMTTGDWIERFKHCTVQQMIERDDFKNRISSGNGVQMSEMFYPIMQGEDSVRIKADIELGGNEQLWTLNIARDMQKREGQDPQVCITLPILRGLDGKKRMGKSLGNFIGVNEPPFEMFSKIMSIPDDLIFEWAKLLTDNPICPYGIESLDALINGSKRNPMDDKKMLARDIVRWLHDWDAAEKAQDQWHKQFTLREIPDDIPVCAVSGFTERSLVMVLHETGLTTSKNNAKRMIEQGAVTIDGVKVIDILYVLAVINNPVIKCGRKFIRLNHEN